MNGEFNNALKVAAWRFCSYQESSWGNCEVRNTSVIVSGNATQILIWYLQKMDNRRDWAVLKYYPRVFFVGIHDKPQSGWQDTGSRF